MQLSKLDRLNLRRLSTKEYRSVDVHNLYGRESLDLLVWLRLAERKGEPRYGAAKYRLTKKGVQARKTGKAKA